MKVEQRFRMMFIATFLVSAFLSLNPLRAVVQAAGSQASVQGLIDAKLTQNELLAGCEIQVTVANKTVTLGGTVRTLAQKEQAGRDAQSVANGHKVINNIALAESGLSGRQVGEAIMAAIDKSPSYFIFDYVGLKVTDQGVATLKGWTTYLSSASEFVKLAQAQPGIRKVENKIQLITYEYSGATIRSQIAELIYSRPKGPGYARMNGPVHILVENRVVTLAGTVEKESDIGDLERAVRQNTGADNVINVLRVRVK